MKLAVFGRSNSSEEATRGYFREIGVCLGLSGSLVFLVRSGYLEAIVVLILFSTTILLLLLASRVCDKLSARSSLGPLVVSRSCPCQYLRLSTHPSVRLPIRAYLGYRAREGQRESTMIITYHEWTISITLVVQSEIP